MFSITSISALKQNKARLNRHEQALFYAYRMYGPMTDQEAAEKLEWYPSRVSARRNGLVSKGLVEECEMRRCRITRNMAKVWRLVPWPENDKMPREQMEMSL